MLSTVHLVTGLVVGTSVFGFVETFVVGVFMHFILDMLPHWDYIIPPHTDTYKWAWLDMLIGWSLVALVLYLTGFYRWDYILVACVGSIFPDVVAYFSDKYAKNHFLTKKYSSFHAAIQYEANVFWGFATQFAVIGLMLYLIFR